MNKQLANDLLKVFDTPMTIDTITTYADMEINKAHVGLATSTDPIEIYRLQGVIRAMNILKTVRTQAENTVKG